ncbi:hypothetical protein [Nesterenkonia halotolerans]|uniref:ABC-type glycerol-3-phosphate transport system substrate-binding protein n=1 Tax=Nesterenkonia halotolerans TaxID=225325 RepID=A0ABR9J544_9MICC|nr:hypothetical protein [Nesterenkonia halotolerans]MBE1514114.1 ABC-type glycerol-3-phosphate transport system substrate-binding protein [Nesterenkonia halotolerans]
MSARSTRMRRRVAPLAIFTATAAGLLTACSGGPPEPQSVEEEALQSMSHLPQVKGAAYSSQDGVLEVTIWDPEEEISEDEVREYTEAAEDATDGVDVQIHVEVSQPPQGN